jgi:D-alanine-D-alanine ligase
MKKIVIMHSDVKENASEDEQDCLTQVKVVDETISALGHQPVHFPFVMDLNANIAAMRKVMPDIVFNLVETVDGRGALAYVAPALMDTIGVCYTGCRTEAMFLTSNKPLAKKILHTHGVDTPPWMMSDGSVTGNPLCDLFIIKPVWEDASVGIDDEALVQTSDWRILKDVLQRRQKKLGTSCFAESYIDGREFNVALLVSKEGVRVLPPAEILFDDYPPGKPKVLDYRAKWVEDSFEYHKTRRSALIAPSDESLAARLMEIGRRLWLLFGLRGYARIDFRVDRQGKPWVLEINANPCLSPDAGFAAALHDAGIKFLMAIDDILRDAQKQ